MLCLATLKAEDVVKEMLDVLDRLAVPIKLMVSFGMDGPNVNKSIMEKLNQVKREKGFQALIYALQAASFMCATTASSKVWPNIDTMLNSFESVLFF